MMFYGTHFENVKDVDVMDVICGDYMYRHLLYTWSPDTLYFAWHMSDTIIFSHSYTLL